MAFKFFNIGKANEEITRLETELARVNAELTATNANVIEITTNAEAMASDLTAARLNITNLTTERDTATASVTTLTTERDALKAQLANPGAQIEDLANKKALVLTAAQGQPPLDIKPEAKNPASQKPEATELKGRARWDASFRVVGMEKAQTETK